MLPHHVTITVPSTKQVDEPQVPSEHARHVHDAMKFMADTFGGVTAVSGHGGYYSAAEQEHVFEPVTLVTSHHDGGGPSHGLPQVFDYARKLARTLGQESIAVTVNGTMHFVEPSAEGGQG